MERLVLVLAQPVVRRAAVTDRRVSRIRPAWVERVADEPAMDRRIRAFLADRPVEDVLDIPSRTAHRGRREQADEFDDRKIAEVGE